MNIQDLRDIVAQINAANPTNNGDFPLLFEAKDSWLTITFITYDGIKVRLHHCCGCEEDWVAIAPFYELSDVAWHLSERHRDNCLISISPKNGKIKVDHDDSLMSVRVTNDGIIDVQNMDKRLLIGNTLEWLEDIHLQALCLFMNFYPFMNKQGHAWSRLDTIVWKAEEIVEELELLVFDEEEFESYHDFSVPGRDWFHLQAAALIARQNTVRKKAKYPALCGINISGVNNNLEISAMCPTSTTYRLIWHDEAYWENFSFTIPVELIDQINQSVDVSTIDSVIFSINPELIKVRVNYMIRIVMNGQAVQMGTADFFAKPIEGRYYYPKVPINQITEKSVGVDKVLLEEAIASAGKGSRDPLCNEVLLQVQDEQLFVHGRKNSFQVDANCTGVVDNEIRVCGVKLLDMLKYVPEHSTVFLDFPDKITQALMLGTCSGVQYLVFGLVKGDRILSSDDATQQLLTIPGISPGEPDLVLQLTEEPILDPPLPEASQLSAKEDLIQTYGLFGEDWEFTAAIDEMCERLIEARTILEGCLPAPEIQALLNSLKEILDDHDYAIAEYEAKDTSDLYYHGGLCKEDLAVEVEAIKDIANSTKLLAGRVQEVSLTIEKTYSVSMKFA